jgi:quercetin dioxygenase-like cupin family protein
MKITKISDMTGGWFAGNFNPTLFKSDEFEAGVKYYKAGEYDKKHYHKIATEITVIISGSAMMGGNKVVAGDIITIPPGEASDFRPLEDTAIAVVKIPCVKGDKYLVD